MPRHGIVKPMKTEIVLLYTSLICPEIMLQKAIIQYLVCYSSSRKSKAVGSLGSLNSTQQWKKLYFGSCCFMFDPDAEGNQCMKKFNYFILKVFYFDITATVCFCFNFWVSNITFMFNTLVLLILVNLEIFLFFNV